VGHLGISIPMILDLQLPMQSVPITVRISIKERCTTLCDKVVSDLLTCDRSMVFSGSSGFLHQYIDCHDINEVLLKLALNTIKQTNQ